MGEVIRLRRVRETRSYEFRSAENAADFFAFVLEWARWNESVDEMIELVRSHRVVDVRFFEWSRMVSDFLDERAAKHGGTVCE